MVKKDTKDIPIVGDYQHQILLILDQELINLSQMEQQNHHFHLIVEHLNHPIHL